ncbi:MAG: hypothetical protein NVSMB45_12130 [Ginsengibacter sp.]
MDKFIEKEVRTQKKKKFIVITILFVCITAATLYFLRTSLNTNISTSQLIIGRIDEGPIENTITAAGEIIPEFEQVISSPIDASIQKVILDQGSAVQPMQPILLLDKSATETEFAKQKFQLESKRNDIAKLKLELGKTFYDVQSNNEIKQLNINSLTASLEDEKRLFRAGGATKEDVSHAELNLKVANLEKKQLENAIKNKQQTMQLEIKEAEIAATIQANDLAALQKKLELANIVATRPGVITWVNKNIGATVKQGEQLVKVADLASFKISGSVSDSYFDKVKKGMTVIAKVNDSLFRGQVISISPSVQNATISFNVQLNERNNKLYRPNMKIDLFLVTDVKKNVLRAPNGPAFKGGVSQDLFVVDNNGKAKRRTVQTGLTNFDYVEIISNLSKGDRIITSDMSEYKNVNEIQINK